MSREIGTPNTFEGQTKPDAITVDAYEHIVFAHRMMTIESNQQALFDYSGGTSVVYAGYAPHGMSQGYTDPVSGADTGWLLQKFAYDINNNVTSRLIAYGNWTNRASYTYS